MKINVLRNLLLPWLAFFLVALAAFVFVGIHFHLLAKEQPLYPVLMAAGAFVCLFLNLRTLQRAGIWVAYSLPLSLRFTTIWWFGRALAAVAVAYAVHAFGQLSWVPLFWHAFVIPAVFAVALFVLVRSLLGPILKWSANISFGRAFTFLFSIPIFFAVPVTVAFLGETIVKAYQASRPELVKQSGFLEPLEIPEAPVAEAPVLVPEARSELALTLRGFAEGGKSCADDQKLVRDALDERGSEETAYWAARAVKCADMKSVVALPKLVDLMLRHKSPLVRAAAIRAMPRFGAENIKRLGYLLVKKISDKEEAIVIEAAADVLAPAGENERKFTISRLKSLLDSSKAGGLAARVLSEDLKREDVVAEYVAENLAVAGHGRQRAIGMICALSKPNQALVEPQLENIVAAVTTGAKEDPAVQALDCLGKSGYQAIRKEVIAPTKLNRVVAARALADMETAKKEPETLATVETCSRDANEEVRKSCSQSLGRIGEPALPKIIDLLKSSDPALKDAGKHALGFFDDPTAKDELRKIRAENSGWMATRKKLQIAEAVEMALIKIENVEARPATKKE